jgi:transposase
MRRPYSNDLRERVAASVASGRSCRETAVLFDVSVASVVRWSQGLRKTGSAAARPMGRPQPRSLAVYREWLLERLASVPDVTLRKLVAELGERGATTSYGSVWRLVRDEGITFKKNAVRHRAGSPRRGAQAAAVEGTSSNLEARPVG